MKSDDNDAVAALIRAAGKRSSVDPEKKARVRAMVHDEWQTTIRRRRVARISGALVALAAGVAAVVWFPAQRAPQPPAPMPVVASVESARGASGLRVGQQLRQGMEVRLPADATASIRWNDATLRLDGGTRLRFDGTSRATLRSGAVYYSDRQHGNSHTFATPFGEVRDIGTRFELRLREDALRVRVRDGLVMVRDRSADGGQELVATRSSIEQRAVATTGEEWSWIERAAPPLLFEGRTLAEILATVAEEKGLTLELIDAAASEERLHGDVPLTPGEALDAATAAAGVSYRIQGTQLIVGTRS